MFGIERKTVFNRPQKLARIAGELQSSLPQPEESNRSYGSLAPNS